MVTTAFVCFTIQGLQFGPWFPRRPVVPRPRDERSENARALLAICELMQCKLLSPPTIAYLAEVRDMLQTLIMAESEQSDQIVSA